VNLDLLAQRLAKRTPRRVFRFVPARRAAVAVILDAEARVLLMERAARTGDRWSSQVSLPGGMEHPEDTSPEMTAARETFEEVGVDLASVPCIGALDERRAAANGGLRPMSVAAFVYRLREPVTPVAGPEAAHAFWFPLERAARGELDSTLTWPILGYPMRFACWRFEGQVVWGFTYDILKRILRLAR
jgi:8-oxo-dGTP pyrophosphatase MutT (NUDIX family)